MAYVSEMVDQLRALLNDDSSDTQVSFATKKLYLNRGILRMWPDIYRIVEDVSEVIPDTATATEFEVSVAMSGGHIVSVEVETGDATGDYVRWNDYDLIVGDEDKAAIIRLTGTAPEAGAKVRIRYAAAVPVIAAASYAAAGSESWSGPDAAIGLPVLYAMGMITAGKVDDRQNTLRYSTMQALNGVTDNDIMSASQMWFGMFEEELLRLGRPLPVARD